jgi:hypothetical protein
MKDAILPPLLSLLLLASSPAASAQTAPPIRMGLWKTQSIMTAIYPTAMAESLRSMGQDPSAPTTSRELACLTSERWRQMFTRTGPDQNCSYLNLKQSSTMLSTDVVCTGAGGQKIGSGHMEMVFESRTKMHGSFRMQMRVPDEPDPVSYNSSLEGEFQGADCQGIQPDSPRPLE